MSSLAWYAGRAATMSPGEALWRARRVVDTLANRDGLFERTDSEILADDGFDWNAMLERFREGIARPVLLDHDRACEVARQQPAATEQLVAEADRVLLGERAYFGYRRVNIGQAVDWSFDPITRYRWPSLAGSRIDHRVAGSDPKWIWELNRLQHLPLLAEAWLFTGDPRYAETAFDHLDSWLDQNPVGTGICWRSAFEPGIRAVSIAIALQGLRKSPAMTAQRFRRIVRMLDATARYCWRARSRFSSANNHVIGELVGLATVHILFPELAAPAALYRMAIDTLAIEADRLILSDGAGAEQSISYQIFTAELLAVVVVLLRLGNASVSPWLVAALDRGAEYLSSLVGSEDPDPRYGDDDDSFALRLGAEPKRNVRQHLGIVAAVTGNVTAARYGEPTLGAAWIENSLQTHTCEIGGGLCRRANQPSAYAPNGGLVVLRGDRRRVTMDVAPLGYLSIAAHGHADALAVTLSHRGHELIVDPGTASFYGNPAVRAAHRGTRAHPTVCVDGLDQSVMGGPFYWRRHSHTTVRAVDLTRGIVDAEHDGYLRLKDAVVHRRWAISPPGDPTVVIVDLLDGRLEHDVAVSWPLHPDLDSASTPAGQVAFLGGRMVLELCYAATSHVEVVQVRGDNDSHLGWWSDRLETRTPAWLVGARCRGAAPVAILSLLRVGECAAITVPEIIRDGVKLVIRWSEHGLQRGLTIDASRPGAVLGVPTSSVVRLVSKS